MSTAPARRTGSGRRTLLILLAVFFVPIAVSFALYYGAGWRPAGRTNHGELIDPARPLPEVQLPLAAPAQAAASSSKPAATLRGKWTLIYVSDGACDAACRRALLVMRQTRLSLNREMERVGRAWLATGNCCDAQLLANEHAGLVAFDASGSAALPLLAQFTDSGAASQWLYVVDPLGNLVMRYDVRANPKGLLEDLKKLLKLSHIG